MPRQGRAEGSVVKQRATSPLVGHEINLVGHDQHLRKKKLNKAE